MTIEGVHRRVAEGAAAGAVVHNAFAVVSYDDRAKRYRFLAFTSAGQSSRPSEEVSLGAQPPQYSERPPIQNARPGNASLLRHG